MFNSTKTKNNKSNPPIAPAVDVCVWKNARPPSSGMFVTSMFAYSWSSAFQNQRFRGLYRNWVSAAADLLWATHK